MSARLGLLLSLGLAAAAAAQSPAELFVDKGDTFVRAGTAQGLKVGSTVTILGPTIGDTQERRRVGTASVLEVWENLARVSLDAAATAAPAPKFAELEKGKAAKPSGAGKAEGGAEGSAGGGLKGRASISGAGPARRLTLYNDGNGKWTSCDVRLPNNKRYQLASLEPHSDESILLLRFAQDGTPRDVPIQSVSVKCSEGSSRFTFSF